MQVNKTSNAQHIHARMPLPLHIRASALAFRFHCNALRLVHSCNQSLFGSAAIRLATQRQILFIKQLNISKSKISIDHSNANRKPLSVTIQDNYITIIELNLSNKYENTRKILLKLAIKIPT